MSWIRKGFFFILATGIFTLFTGFARLPQETADVLELEHLKSFTDRNEFALKMPDSDLDEKSSNFFKKIQEFSLDSEPGASADSSNDSAPIWDEKIEVIDGKRMVAIDGQYYEYREDHIYQIAGGRKVYFADFRKRELPRPTQDLFAGAQSEERALADYESAKQKFQESPKEGAMPTSEAFERVKALKNLSRSRAKYLDSIK